MNSLSVPVRHKSAHLEVLSVHLVAVATAAELLATVARPLAAFAVWRTTAVLPLEAAQMWTDANQSLPMVIAMELLRSAPPLALGLVPIDPAATVLPVP